MSYLLDTNVLSETRRRIPDAGVADWLRTMPQRRLFISVLTIGEVRRGVELLRSSDRLRADALDRWATELGTRFSGQLLPITPLVADRWGRLGVPDALPAVDGLIAATALVHGLTVVTRNVKDFERAGVPVLNPFTR